MPLYEYECAQCHKRTEKIQKFSDAPLTVCPHCGGHLEKTLTAPAVQFKGGGWYSDLYSSSNASAKSANAKTESSSSAPAESKPAATPATAPASTPSSSDKK